MKLLFRLGLGLSCLTARVLCQVFIQDLFTVQGGTTNGGCDNYRMSNNDILDNYLTECIDSLTAAINAIQKYGDGTLDGDRVKDAIFTFFGYRTKQEAMDIQTNLVRVQDFFNNKLTNINKKNSYLYCDSSWLIQQDPSTTAKDYQGADIKVNGNNVAIQDIPEYSAQIQGNIVPFFTGNTPNAPAAVQGYYFAKSDGSDGNAYCNRQKNWGLTSKIQKLVQQPAPNPPMVQDEEATMILCPQSFTRTDVPDYYDNAGIKPRNTLQKKLPRSTTLLHEAFHLCFGAAFLGTEGKKEFYLLSQVTNLRKTPDKASTNPETYVFFTAAMYYLFGDTLDNPPPPSSPITSYWDFTSNPSSAKSVTRP